MQPTRFLLALTLLAGLLTSLLIACGDDGGSPPSPSEAGATPGPIPVAVSLPPQAWLVERLGGERVTVSVLLPPGTSPATYELSPQQVVALDRARLFVAVGHPAFPFERQVLGRLLGHRRDLTVVEMTGHLGALTLPGHGHGEEPEGIDPHVWTAPQTMLAAAEGVAAALARLDPAHADAYRANLDDLRRQIAELDRELAARFAAAPGRRFWVLHPAWGYLARQYGLEQVALESGGKEMSAARLVATTEQARREDVRVIFVQRGFSDRTARALAREIGARVVELDPLARDWPGNLRRVAAKLAPALTAPPE